MIYALLSLALFSTISTVWWISISPNDPAVYIRLITVWQSCATVRSYCDHRHPRNSHRGTSSFPLPSIDSNTLMRTLIECWFTLLITIIMDLRSPILDRHPVLSTSESDSTLLSSTVWRTATPVLIIDFGIQPFVVVLVCALSVIVTGSSSSHRNVTRRSHRFSDRLRLARLARPPRPDIEACNSDEEPVLQSSLPFQQPFSDPQQYDSYDLVEGRVQCALLCNDNSNDAEDEKEECHLSVTKFLSVPSDGKVGRPIRVKMDDTPPKPLQVFINIEVHQEAI